MTFLETLVLGSYAFTAGAYIFVWRVYNLVINHHRTKLKELEERLSALEPDEDEPWGGSNPDGG